MKFFNDIDLHNHLSIIGYSYIIEDQNFQCLAIDCRSVITLKRYSDWGDNFVIIQKYIPRKHHWWIEIYYHDYMKIDILVVWLVVDYKKKEERIVKKKLKL